MAIHEIIHFVWFHVWNELFGDSYDEYESPSMKWIFSEMVVESIMSDERLCSLNPYFPRENGGCIYPYFFDMEANGENVLATLNDMYKNKKINDFMKDGYAYCIANEKEIRNHIATSENQGPEQVNERYLTRNETEIKEKAMHRPPLHSLVYFLQGEYNTPNK